MSKYSGDDHCVDPESGVLKNLFGISSEEELEETEAEHAATRSYDLSLRPLSGAFDLAHLQALHHYLFQDVYAWAGKIRDVDLAGLDPDRFSKRAAHYLGELNALHPFREGTGRVVREFIGQLASSSGYEIAWENTSREEMLEASIASFRGDESRLASIIRTNLESADQD